MNKNLPDAVLVYADLKLFSACGGVKLIKININILNKKFKIIFFRVHLD
jgi:hypothetical protein